MAQQSIYLKTAYEKLEEISTNPEKRLVYTERQKALYDYNTLAEENFERGVEQGKGETRAKYIQRMKANGLSDELIKKIISD